jgi:hypothetical protein
MSWMRCLYIHAALAVGIAIGTGLAYHWDGIYLVLPMMGWLFIMPMGSLNPLERWQPRHDPEGKVYAWVRPIENDIVWTKIIKTGMFRWNMKR